MDIHLVRSILKKNKIIERIKKRSFEPTKIYTKEIM